MLLTGAESIRDVIAFPKAASGLDPLTGAPTVITEAQRREAGIDVVPQSSATPHAAPTSPVPSTPPNPSPHGAPSSAPPVT